MAEWWSGGFFRVRCWNMVLHNSSAHPILHVARPPQVPPWSELCALCACAEGANIRHPNGAGAFRQVPVAVEMASFVDDPFLLSARNRPRATCRRVPGLGPCGSTGNVRRKRYAGLVALGPLGELE